MNEIKNRISKAATKQNAEAFKQASNKVKFVSELLGVSVSYVDFDLVYGVMVDKFKNVSK